MTQVLTDWLVEQGHQREWITNPRIYEDEGSPGYSEYTPSEPWELEVHYDHADGKTRAIRICPGEAGPFIERLVALAAE